MAGFYPDVPDNRFAYHLDGTKIYVQDANNTLTEITSTAPVMNDEDVDNAYGLSGKIAMIFSFPEMRNISGYYFNGYWTPTSLQVSSDTTTLLDGTWTTIANPWSLFNDGDPYPEYRQKIQTVTAGSVKALRFNMSDIREVRNLHLYGSIPVTSNPDRLIFWQTSTDAATGGAYFDWGDIVQGSSQTKDFRLKNNSTTKTANSISLISGNETFGMNLEFSTDGTTFTPSVNIGNLAPGAISSVLYVRRTVPTAENLQVQACYLKASAGSWV
jgi:hypothetical protein